MYVFALLEKTRVPGENPHSLGESIQIPHKKAGVIISVGVNAVRSYSYIQVRSNSYFELDLSLNIHE